MEREIVCDATSDFIYHLVPHNIKDDIVRNELLTNSIEDIFRILKETLLRQRERTIFRIRRSNLFDKKTEDIKPSEKYFPGQSNNLFKKHNCSRSYQCKRDLNILGCVKLYSIKKVDERRNLLMRKKNLFKMRKYVQEIQMETS